MSENENEKKPIEIIFAPGCFDDFEGSQEELDEMVAEIKRLAESGELFERSRPLDVEDLIEEMDPLDIEDIVNEMTTPRKLQ